MKASPDQAATAEETVSGGVSDVYWANVVGGQPGGEGVPEGTSQPVVRSGTTPFVRWGAGCAMTRDGLQAIFQTCHPDVHVELPPADGHDTCGFVESPVRGEEFLAGIRQGMRDSPVGRPRGGGDRARRPASASTRSRRRWGGEGPVAKVAGQWRATRFMVTVRRYRMGGPGGITMEHEWSATVARDQGSGPVARAGRVQGELAGLNLGFLRSRATPGGTADSGPRGRGVGGLPRGGLPARLGRTGRLGRQSTGRRGRRRRGATGP